MIRCMIIEDEPLARKILEKYIRDTEDLHIASIATNGEEAFKMIEVNPVELIFLDVNLPKLSGLNFYKSLPEKPRVIFTTAYPDYAVEGFELEAIDYLLKPISYERFIVAVEKAREKLGQSDNNDFLVVKQDRKLFRISTKDITHIESLGDFVKIFTADRTYLSNDTLKELTQKLPKRKFARIHKSFIVSLEAIDYMEGNRLVIAGEKIPVGHSYREEIAKYFKK